MDDLFRRFSDRPQRVSVPAVADVDVDDPDGLSEGRESGCDNGPSRGLNSGGRIDHQVSTSRISELPASIRNGVEEPPMEVGKGVIRHPCRVYNALQQVETDCNRRAERRGGIGRLL
jgi:hypothetical protein